MLIVTGWNSRITQELLRMLPHREETMRAELGMRFPLDGDRYLFASGLLRPQATMHQVDGDMAETFMVNCGRVIRACDQILAANSTARICVIGSESGFTWSFDGTYAAAKAALHRYVETKKLTSPEQQLVCLSPGIISDCGMTTRREDQGTVAARSLNHPKRRHLTAEEVARWVHFLLYVDRGYASGTVIRLNGGEHTR